MSPELFIVWLQGYLAATGGTLTAEQVTTVKTELDAVVLRGPYRRNAPVPVAPKE